MSNHTPPESVPPSAAEPTAPAPAPDTLPDTIADPPAPLDAHGHDPAAYDWVPVLRKPRQDGWTPVRQREFIQALADTGSVEKACAVVGLSRRGAYALRRAPGAQGFDRAWAAAIDAAGKRLLDEAFERALVGSDEPVFDKQGNRIGRRFRKSDAMLQFLLRGYFPERFGATAQERQAAMTLDADGNVAAAATAPAAARARTLPVAQAISAMLPEPPVDPAALLDADELALQLHVADQWDGELPSYRRQDPW